MERGTQREIALSSIIESSRFNGQYISETTWTSLVNGAWDHRHLVGRGPTQDMISELLDTAARESLD